MHTSTQYNIRVAPTTFKVLKANGIETTLRGPGAGAVDYSILPDTVCCSLSAISV